MKSFCWILLAAGVADAQNFTTGSADAKKFGVHEVALTGNGSVANPFDTSCTVTFTAPSGTAKAVGAFHDGGSVWRARVYVSETGTWTWRSSSGDAGLNAKSGSFVAQASALRGRLLPHPSNPKHWITEDGRWFLNLNDTAYHLFSPRNRDGTSIPESDFQSYVRDAAARGITSFRSWAVFASDGTGGFASNDGVWPKAVFADTAYTKFRAENFRRTDDRLIWLHDALPDLAVQLILLPTTDYGTDDSFWASLSTAQRQKFMKYLIARYAAFPSIFWLVINDTHYGAGFPNNDAMAREVGAYFAAHDPWKHPMSTGPNRNRAYPFPGESWSTYLHIEDEHDLGAAEFSRYAAYAKPVFLGEDRYEQDHMASRDPAHMRYWQRRLFWAWLLSGGSANYGGRWWVTHPYSQTGTRSTTKPGTTMTFTKQLVGLDSVGVIPGYFASRNIRLPDFAPDHALASDLDGRTGAKAPRLMRRGTSEVLVYHPNAAADGQSADVATTTARLRVNLAAASGTFQAEWFRVHDGVAQSGGTVSGGAARDFNAPWAGHDVVLRLLKASTPSQAPYGGSPGPVPGTIEAERYDLGGEGVAFHDTTAGNAGGAFRADDVDIQTTAGGYNVGWLAAGEWMEYTVDVATAGTYTLEARVATPNTGRTFRVEAGGVDKTGPLAVPTTGDFQAWQTIAKSVSLSAGTQVLRIHTDTGGFNLDRIRFLAASGAFTVTIDAVSTGRTYALSTAQAGALPYTDRSYTITSIGTALAGARMIRTAMDDKYVTAASHLRFTLSAPAVVYACMDRRAASPPDWLEDGSWTLTALAISTTDGPASPMRVYSKSASGTLTLGGNHQGGDTLARANYFVLVSASTTSAAKELLEDAWIHEGDRDGDGLWDVYEEANGLDPDVADSDGNGTPDEHELTPLGKSHWDAQGVPAPSGDDDGSSSCGLLGLEILLLSPLLRRRRAARHPRG